MTAEELEKKLSKLNDDSLPFTSVKTLHKLCEEYKPKTVLEIGTYLGKSAYLFKEMGAEVWSVDINEWHHKGIYCLHADSNHVYWERKVDLIFIDGSHEYTQVINDIRRFMPYARKVICGHDYNEDFDGVIRAVDDFFGKNIEIENGIWIFRKINELGA